MDLKWMRAAADIHAPPRPKLVVPASARCPDHQLKLCLGQRTSRVAPVSCRLLMHAAAGLHDASLNLLRLQDLRSAAEALPWTYFGEGYRDSRCMLWWNGLATKSGVICISIPLFCVCACCAAYRLKTSIHSGLH